MTPRPTIHETINGILRLISGRSAALKELESQMASEIEAIQRAFEAKIAAEKEALGILEHDLVCKAKNNKAEVFGDGDRADYDAGALLLKAEVHIRRARCVLTRLESMGRDDLMKIQKQVDWAALADKPDAFLAALGTGREIREKIGYDLKGAA